MLSHRNPAPLSIASESERAVAIGGHRFISKVLGGVSTAALIGMGLLLSSPVHAADLTEVADAADEDDPFDANIELDFDFMRHTGLIVRENAQDPGNGGAPRTVRVRELAYERIRFRLTPRAEVGLFHDLAVFAQIPIIL